MASALSTADIPPVPDRSLSRVNSRSFSTWLSFSRVFRSLDGTGEGDLDREREELEDSSPLDEWLNSDPSLSEDEESSEDEE